MTKPKKPDDPEPSTYFEIEQHRLQNPGEEKAGGPRMPRLPETSPWHHDPVPPEPTINREEDGDFINGDFA
jgi:hypothetical protein